MKTTIRSLFALLLVGCAAVSVDLPSITESPTGNRDIGRVVWHDLLTTTPEASRRFYGELFGWTFERPGIDLGFGNDESYMLIRHNGRLIGGIVDANTLDAEGNVSQWITVISSNDVQSAVAAVSNGGGEILTPPTSLPSRGELAVVQDAAGAIFAILEARNGNPAAREPAVGDFLWDELWTRDVENQVNFYTRVFDYEDSTHQVDDAPYRLMSRRNEPRTGIMANPFPDEKPVWINYLRVDNPADITVRAEKLGGAVLVQAQATDIGGTVALIAGPSGAGIGLQSWPLQRREQQ